MLKSQILILSAFALAASAFAADSDFESMFRERAKCAVSVRYSVELEENRNLETTSGTVIDETGLIIVPEKEIPVWAKPSELKDFKVFFPGGDSEGLPADYLGADAATGMNFIRIRGGLPKNLVPYSKFARAKTNYGKPVWGVGIICGDGVYEYYVLKSYVAAIGKRPLEEFSCGDRVANVGAPVFDSDGNFVGFGQTEWIDNLRLFAEKIKGMPITLADPSLTNSFILPEIVEDAVKHIPENPSMLRCGWIGLVNTKVLKRDVAKMMNIDKCALVVSEVVKDSPSGRAGLQKGDIITRADGRDIEELTRESFTLNDFYMKCARKKPNDKMTLTVIRGSDAPKDFELTVAANPKHIREAQSRYFKRLGFSVREFLFQDAVGRKNVDKNSDEAVVKYVKPNSPAASALPSRLSGDDIIKEINSKPVATYTEAVAELEKINADDKAKELVILAEDFNETKVVRIKLD